MNVQQLMQLLSKGGDPQAFTMNMLKEQANYNPIFANILHLAQNGDGQSIESIARNILKERGLDFDKEFNSFKNNLKL